MPKRSASRMTITVALGTSTPTSMTVVATSTSTSPARKRSITASFSAAATRPWSSSTRRPASSPCLAGEPVEGLLGRGAPRASRTPRSAGTRRRPGGRRPPRRARAPTRLVLLARPAPGVVRDRRAARRQLVEHRDVEVAVDGHRRGARDRRRRHHEHVGGDARSPLSRSAARCSTPKRCCSSITTTPSDENATVALDEGVGADDDVDLAGAERREDRLALGRRWCGWSAARPAPAARRRGCRRRRPSRPSSSTRMPRKCCSASTSVGRHERALVAALHGDEQGADGDDRLARADVALEEPVHRVRAGEVGGDLADRPLLRAGERERQRARGSGARAGRRRRPSCAGCPSRSRSSARLRSTSASWTRSSSSNTSRRRAWSRSLERLGRVDAAERPGAVDQVEPVEHGRRAPARRSSPARREHLLDPAGHVPAGHAGLLGLRVDRDDPARPVAHEVDDAGSSSGGAPVAVDLAEEDRLGARPAAGARASPG